MLPFWSFVHSALATAVAYGVLERFCARLPFLGGRHAEVCRCLIIDYGAVRDQGPWGSGGRRLAETGVGQRGEHQRPGSAWMDKLRVSEIASGSELHFDA